jgi:hypothetical protein
VRAGLAWIDDPKGSDMQWFLRTLAVIAMLLAGMQGLGNAGAAAQDAPGNPFSDLGLPEIAVEITDSAIVGAPSELAAGRYVLTVTNATEEESLGVGFLQPPAEMTASEFIEFAAPATPEDAEQGAASPAAEESGPPAFYYEIPLAGGIYAGAGESASTVLDLTAGEWVLWVEEPGAPQAPVLVVVTGEAPADQPAPEADVTITGQEMSFTVDGELVAGPQVIEFVNAGQQPHFIAMLKVPEGTTIDDFLALAATFGDPAASPPAGLSFEDITTGFDTADQSSGVTTWIAADLESGTYILVCFVPDPESGAPHAMLGMIDVVTVP